MTREEAIKRLKKCRSFHNGSYGEAFAMAIKALEQESCEDWCDVPSDEMTLEQARQAVKDLRKKLAEYLMKETCEDCVSRQAAIDALAEWHDVAITNRLNNLPPAQPSVSKTETVEDCISRQAAIDAVSIDNLHPGIVEALKSILAELPPVTPQPKIGRWIFVDKAHEHAHCSECDYGNVDLMDGRPHNFCPNCGAKIQEVKE